jgi:hypothetical protein
MKIPCARPPIIVLGMHRSGTSMICGLLRRLGLFTGQDLDSNHESKYFVDLNETMFSRINASWDNPRPVKDFLAQKEPVRMTANALHADLVSYRIGRFLGLRQYLGCRSLNRFNQPWGWKDPRTIYTLPVWLNLFPEARIVYVVRHGVDVANSLIVRQQKLLAERTAKFDARMGELRFKSHLCRAGYRGSARCLSLEGAFGLWEEYVQEAQENLRGIPNARCEIRYEEFLSEPKKHLAALVKFCELPGVDEQALDAAASQVKPERSKAFSSDPALCGFSEKVKTNAWMVQYGY